jgi:transposase
MHLVEKIIKGRPYYYLIKTERRGKRVVTSRTVYLGVWKKVAQLVENNILSAFPRSFSAQEVGASLAFTAVAEELGIEKLIDETCPVRTGAAPVGRDLLLIALHRALVPRWENGLSNVQEFYNGCALAELLPISETSLDGRRLGETLSQLSATQIEAIESAVVQRIVEHEDVSLDALAFDCTNFDSYVAAANRSRLLKRGHAKSGRSLRALGLALLVTEDGGIPLLTFSYPGNNADVTAFTRFLGGLDRRRASLPIPMEATIAADGGNISKAILRRLEQPGKRSRHYVLRLPERHACALSRVDSAELPIVRGLRGKARAQKYTSTVYSVERCVVDVYSPRMHSRQLPGLLRDRKKARADLVHLQKQLELQRRGLRRAAEPITIDSLKRRVDKARSREHMADLFSVQMEAASPAPTLSFQESKPAWKHLQTHVLGRTLLVTSRAGWSTARIVRASRQQSHNEWFFRDVKSPIGISMLPLRHGRDPALRATALVVVLGLMLAKVILRRLRKSGVDVRSVGGLLRQLKKIQRARLHLPDDAPPGLRALAASSWVPSQRTSSQEAILRALHLTQSPSLGTTLFSTKTSSRRPNRRKRAA